ncbi:MAG: hypothetical protein IKL80_04635 [Clostridia bacterium]|nr:hypothetical protein [Clostridia bacterium]
MLKAFSKKTLSLLLALCMVLSCGLVTVSAAAPSVTATSEVTSTDKAGALYNDGTAMQYMGTGKYLRSSCMNTYSLDILLPSVGGADEAVEMFSLSVVKNGHFDYGYNTVVIRGGQVFNSYFTKHPETGSLTKVEEEIICNDAPLMLEACKWYNFRYETNIATGDYTLTVKDVAADSVLASVSGTNAHTYTLDLNESGGVAWANTRLSLIGAVGFEGAVLFDNMLVDSRKEDGSYFNSGYQSRSTNFDSAAIGSAARLEVVGSTAPAIAGLAGKIATDDKCIIVAKDNYMVTGVVDTVMPTPVTLTFTDVDPAALTAENIKFMADGAAAPAESYVLDVLDNVATVVFIEPLAYETTYSFDLTALGITKKLFFKTPVDPFVTTGSVFLNADGNEIYGVPAQGNTIKAQVMFDNGDFDSRNYLVLLVIYDGDNMVAAASAQGMIDAGLSGAPAETPAITMPAGENLTAQILVWNDWQGSYAMSAANVLE